MEYFQRAVDITPRMANRLIKALRRIRVECIVAPYEADAQLAYLSIKGYVQAVIRCPCALRWHRSFSHKIKVIIESLLHIHAVLTYNFISNSLVPLHLNL